MGGDYEGEKLQRLNKSAYSLFYHQHNTLKDSLYLSYHNIAFKPKTNRESFTPLTSLIRSSSVKVAFAFSLFLHQFFQLEVYNSDGSRMTESQIHNQLLRIRSQSWKTDKEPVGILTSEHRHTWGQAYNRLLRGRSQSYVHSHLMGVCSILLYV